MNAEITSSVDGLSEVPEFNGKTLVIWSGGREHKLAMTLAESESTGDNTVFVSPGNAGTDLDDRMTNVGMEVADIDEILDFIKEKNIGLTVVWPEDPLAKWLVDAFYKRGLDKEGYSILWPNKAAAQLESSKTFTKEVCEVAGIKTAAWESFTDLEAAKQYVNDNWFPIVLKADWLAAGKGVKIVQTSDEAYETLEDMLSWNAHWEAGHKVLIEEFLDGEEASIIVMVDENGTAVPMMSSQDHKAVGEWDEWANTGGMWAYSPASHLMTPELVKEVMRDVIQPTIDYMKEEGIPFSWFLYAGLMITKDKQTGKPVSNLIEYNVRFGDPETQVVLSQLPKWTDFAKMCHNTANGNLDSMEQDEIDALQQSTKFSVNTVLCAVWYPDKYKKGYKIELPEILNQHKDEHWVEYIHAGTQLDGNRNIIGTWGRVLSITATADSVEEAVAITNQYAEMIVAWSKDENGEANLFYRSDIWHKAIATEKEEANV